jgi:hypothetical protein
LAKKKSVPPPDGRLQNIVALRGTAEWKAWLDGLAEANGAPLTVTIEQALRDLAAKLRHDKPPRRLP